MESALDDARRDRAYEAMDAGDLDRAAEDFAALAREQPDDTHLQYMLGLAAKYQANWKVSLAANLVAIAQQDRESARWNAAIAATALGDWAQARAQWKALGIEVPGESGPIETNFGQAALRLNPSIDGEVVYGTRIDPVRMVIDSVPLPESGYRHGDIVLNDGAVTGERRHGERRYRVFNALARLQPSEFRTHTVVLHVRNEEGLEALRKLRAHGIASIEDWTDSIEILCRECSYGVPHEHREPAPRAWSAERKLGIAAKERAAIDAWLAGWTSRWKGRRVLGIEAHDLPVPTRVQGEVWWCSPEQESAEET